MTEGGGVKNVPKIDYVICERPLIINILWLARNTVTKPLFTEQKIMNLENLHVYHTFMELFKILKFDVSQFIKDRFRFCPKNEKLRLIP